ncbi:Uncharacterized protein BM_BM9562 [Brugia malayi]|uniref:Uncharacterized protein n=2 Tax=Brugia malayi TaxID=6279 RepID=A0A4E9F1B3_BRUMA|nr:Uncharacterized protein BM_BM9562 [Brugia malayi]VIO88918.1 Uncharacterized protein BM_BM9562 [Brugia malayi]
MFADKRGEGMKFVVLEKAVVAVKNYIHELYNTTSKASADMSVKEAMVEMFSAAVNMEKIRPPRMCCPFRGTPKWASGHAQKGRQQTHFDDLIFWLYVTCELFAKEREPIQPLPPT